MRKAPYAVAAAVLVVCLVAVFLVKRGPVYQKYTDSFFDTFDTVVTVVAYTKNKAEFDSYFEKIHARMQELHRMYDIYNSYPGLNNVKTINDMAGKAPVKVNKEIIDLILFSKDWYQKTGGATNIAMGSVLRIWHDYREAGQADPESAKIPPMEDLVRAAQHTDIEKVVVDATNSTVYLADPEMSLDVGAVAKGFATELVMREMADAGLKSALISSGGNIRGIGKPLDGVRESWSVGIQDPAKSIFSEDNLLGVVQVTDGSVATSGGYQRYYIVDDKVLHHLIDPKTLMPADYYQSVSIMASDAGVTDFMSTTAFLLPYEASRKVVESVNVDALWVFPDGRIEMTPGMRAVFK